MFPFTAGGEEKAPAQISFLAFDEWSCTKASQYRSYSKPDLWNEMSESHQF